MRKIISLICFLLPAIAVAAQPEFRPDAPDQHVVVPGDTLWGISKLFFKDPWKLRTHLERQQKRHQRPALDLSW